MVVSQTRFVISDLPVSESGGLTPDLGPTHPGRAGLLTGTLTIRDGVVEAIDPEPGALHRGAEVLFQARDYRQALSLANRHDWQAPFFGEWALARLVEAELGVEVPVRAEWIRALLAEHTRILSHLGYLTFVGWRLGEPGLATDPLREEFRLRTAELTGNRLHPMAVRLGGVACDVTEAWARAEREGVAAASGLGHRLARAAEGLGAGVAVVSPRHVDDFGLSGPVARASGVRTDLRLTDPGPAYAAASDLLEVDAAPTDGDARARFVRLAREVVASAALVERLLDTLPDGPLEARLPKVVKLPEGDAYAAVEAPLGRAGMFVVSRGDKTPWRLRLRTPSFAHVSAWPAVIPGTRVDDLAVALASLPWVAGDLDK